MDSEKDFLKKDLNTAETKEAVESVKESAELLGHEDIVTLAQQKLEAILAKVQSVETTPLAQVTQVESMGGSADEIKKRTEGVDEKINAVNAEAVVKIGQVKGEATEVVERPPVPPLPEKQVKTEDAVAPIDTLEDEVKAKKFLELQTRFNEEKEKKDKDPENPLNKIYAVLVKDKQVIEKVARYAGNAGLESEISQKLGISQTEFEIALPDLLEKGLISDKDCGYYLSQNSFLKGSDRLNMPRVDKIMERFPIQTLDRIAGQGGILGGVLDDWYTGSQEEIAKEKVSQRRDDAKMLGLISNAGRFSAKEEMSGVATETVDGYLKNGYNIGRLRQEDGSYPVLENLCRSGFSDQAERILQKGLSSGLVYSDTIFEYTKKGYITPEKAKAILDKAGRLV